MRPMARDYYDILNVPRDAADDAIKKAYRKLAKKYHPDVNADEDAKAKFAQVQEAYDVLSDAKKRKQYDRYGHAGVNAGAGAGQTGGGPFGGGAWRGSTAGPGGFSFGTDGAEGVDLDDLFGQFFGGGRGRGGGRSAFGGMGGGARARARRQPQRGADLQHTVTVPFETAARGGKTSLRIKGPGGEQTIDVKVPKAVADGAKLRVRGKGQPSPEGGPAGDIILTVKIAPHPYFKREGLNLTLDLPISIDQAIFGGEVEVPTLDGRATLKIPPRTGGGKRLRLRGAGIENNKGEKGDLFAVPRIDVPEELTEAQREALQKLRGTWPDPRRGLKW